MRIETSEAGRLEVHGHTAAQIGELAAARGIALHELVARQASLEDAFIRLTGASVEFHAEADETPEVSEVAA